MADSKARERVLQAAERLFVERGYGAVTVKDIAKATGIHHASIYHHIPGGKADLFVETMTRHFHQHQEGIQQAIHGAGSGLHAQLLAIAAWLLSQPPVDLLRLSNSDLPSIDSTAAQELESLAYFALLLPIMVVLEQAQARGEISHPNLGNIAGAFLNSIEGLHTIPEKHVLGSRLAMAEQLVDVFIRGIGK